MGIELGGSNSTLSFNIIHTNGGAGVATTGSGTGNTFTRNSFYANGTVQDALGIDLEGDGVTLNDNNDSDSGSNILGISILFMERLARCINRCKTRNSDPLA